MDFYYKILAGSYSLLGAFGLVFVFVSIGGCGPVPIAKPSGSTTVTPNSHFGRMGAMEESGNADCTEAGGTLMKAGSPEARDTVLLGSLKLEGTTFECRVPKLTFSRTVSTGKRACKGTFEEKTSGGWFSSSDDNEKKGPKTRVDWKLELAGKTYECRVEVPEEKKD